MFISESIKVTRDKKDKSPVGFVWRGESKTIIRIISEWQDWGFASGVHKGDWKQRRHRNYFRVECDDGKLYEIYLDRKTSGKPTWHLFRIINDK
ncbi:MAG: hypothetical protein GY839_06510 [candidate division Zixibacteria bacterium]|nr:hypothetical protein [candidate division Zixibacteria bacterium]